MLPLPKEGEDPDRPPTAIELCATYACKTTYLTFVHNGVQKKNINR